MSKLKELSAPEKSIISQALAEVKTKKDIPVVLRKVRGTAVEANKKAMKLFEKLLDLKKATLRDD